MSEAQPSTDRSNAASIRKILSRPFELTQRPARMSIEYEPICATDSTSSNERSAERALACGALVAADVARDGHGLRWPWLLVGLVLTCVIAASGSARHGL